MSDLIKRTDAVAAIANLHVSHDREEIFKAYAKNPYSMTTDFEGTLIDAINAVEALPSADRPQGEWIPSDTDGFVCSVCKNGYRNQPTLMGRPMFEYCPVCGARMKGADDEV